MAWREYLNLFVKYEGDISLATEREIGHADRGMDPALARQIAEADYKRTERIKHNEQNQKVNQKVTCDDSCTVCRDNLFF